MLNAQCKDFKCAPGKIDCCCQRVLYSQPDFIHVESKLETRCKQQGFDVFFLPQFHCELNFIEQCWGFAKQVYRRYPPSSKEADLQLNLVSALESVPLKSMQKWVHIISEGEIPNLDLGLLQNHSSLQMHTDMDLMGNRLPGQPKSIGGTECSHMM